ncbi:MAG: adenylosuccinate lyase [archaeon]|nr:MAG: adenylosuccinate lyase [archaeon]
MSSKRDKDAQERFGYDSYLSPFTWRYASKEMRALFSEEEKRATWRKVWLSLAQAQGALGLLSKREVKDIRSKSGRAHLDIAKAHNLEGKIRHDLMAELRTFADQAKVGGGKLHLGATSMDIEDNADILIYRKAVAILRSRILEVLAHLRTRVVENKEVVCMAWTHLQPAEPTTLGYRFANYAQDLVLDLKLLDAVRDTFLGGKGIKGAVGTSASFKALLGTDAKVRGQEAAVMKILGIEAFEVTGQTYPRKVDFVLLSCLASVAQSCHKFGLDLRVMQSPAFGEWAEPFGERQVGSSAMPFKRNPITAERMCSLARLVGAMPPVAFSNAASSILERTLDDSAARRIAVPESFLAVEECLILYGRLAGGLRVFPEMIKKNVARYGPFAGTEPLMMELSKKGGDRQKLHEMIRVKSQLAWEEVMMGRANPIERLLAKEKSVSTRITGRELSRLMDPKRHVGDAASRCDSFVRSTLDPILAKARRRSGSEKRGF